MDLSNTPPASPAPDDDRLNLIHHCVKPLIALVSVLAVGISVLCLSFGYSVVFPHLYYLPIIIMCAFFPKYALYFTTGISVVYICLVMGITRDLELLGPALVRSLFFEVNGAIMIVLSNKRLKAEAELHYQRMNLASIVREQTDYIVKELEQSQRLEKAYREATEYYDRMLNQANVSLVIWNSGMYITRTNGTFERLLGKPKSELIGRKISAVLPLEEAALRSPDKPVIIPLQGDSGETHQVLWTFSDIYAADQTSPFALLAIGQEIS